MRRTLLALLPVTILLCAMAPASATAAKGPPPDVEPPVFQTKNPNALPLGFTVTPAQAMVIAKRSTKLEAIHRAHHPLHYAVYAWAYSHYEIYFSFHGKPIADQIVTRTGVLGPTYTGGLIIGIYARGHYGQAFDAAWVLVGFTVMFLLPLLLLRRCSWLDRLDIAILLGFGASYARFDTAHLGSAVWLFYVPLVYLLVRMLMRGATATWKVPRIDVRLPTAVLVIGLLALVAGRIVVCLSPANVVDVATASALGANRILHGQSIYYYSIGHPDTYGPLAYLAYVPFLAFWKGSWSYLLAAREAAITFDLLTIAGLVWFGFRLRRGRAGWRLGLLLAWLWAACPFTVLGMEKSTNDGLIALIVVLVMLTLNSPIKRGVVVGLGAASKFFPAVLLPLVAIGPGTENRSAIRKVLAGFVIVTGASFALFLPPGGITEVWSHTIGYQLTRQDIFSIWAMHPGLAPIKVALELGAVILAVAVAFRPRGPRTPAQVSALGAAVIISVQIPAMHWLYLYIVWFVPLVLIAVLAGGAPSGQEPAPVEARVEPEPAQRENVLAGTA
jgi:Glycosyltransferase family 87